MPFTVGDNKTPWGGLYDEFDKRDSVPGTFKDLTNVVVGRNFSTIEQRGGFPKWIDLPTVGNGLKTGLTIVKVLHGAQFRVTKPSEQLITILVCLCSYQPSGGGGLQYTWRIFQNPSYSAPNFGAATSWQEKEIFYIDIVETNKTLTRTLIVSANEKYEFTVTAPVNGAYFKGDLPGGYIYLEDASHFATPNLHLAEADLIIDDPNNDFNAATNVLTVAPESGHSTEWSAAGTDFVRYHKNLEDGFLPYSEICDDASDFFDQFTFSHYIENEVLHLSVNAGESGRASFEMRIGYVKRTNYSKGRLWGQSNYSYANGGNYDRYDKRLVYGFPGYRNIIKNGVNSFNGKNINDSGVVVSGSYDKITGKFTASINTQNYIIGTGGDPEGSFVSIGQGSKDFKGMAALGSDVYASVDAGDIYKQTGGVGNFNALSQTVRAWRDMTSANGNVYACVAGGDIYMQTAGSGNFNALSQTTRNWQGMTSIGSDVYACVPASGIYKQTGGTGNFASHHFDATKQWQAIVAVNGDLYACVYGGDIYVQIGASGSFLPLNQVSRDWTAMTAASNGDIYASVYNGSIYVKKADSDQFVATGTDVKNWEAMTFANGNIYAAEFYIWLRSNKGTLDVSEAIDDFLITESDVHGRAATFKDFNAHSNLQSSYVTPNPSIAGANYKPTISGYFLSGSADGIAKVNQETDFTNNTFFHVAICAIYNGFRYGFHSEGTHGFNSASYLVANIFCKIPASANKNIDGIAITMAAGYANLAAMTIQALLTDLRTVKLESLKDAEGWDFYLCFPDGITANGDTHQYVKRFRVDKLSYDTINIAGDHLDLTANPTYSRKTTSEQEKKSIVLSPDLEISANGLSIEKQAHYVMVGDYSFGAKTSIVIKNRLYFAGVKYQEFQLGEIQSKIFEDNYNVFYSGIGQFGGNYHGFDFSQNKINCSDIGPVVAVNFINFPQGLEQVITRDRDSLIILGENGVKFVDLSDNLLTTPVISSSPGDTCIARQSVVNEGGILFCAGETGVYMFRGYQKVDITLNLHPKARIKKTWRELDRAKKQKAIGAFHRGRGYYILCIPDDNTMFVFDIQGAQTQ